jgi:HEAT repeat protein
METPSVTTEMTNLRWICMLAFALLAAGCGKSTEDWASQMKAADPAARLRAVHSLQDRQETATIVPALAEALRDENTYVRRDAARALARFGPEAKEAVPILFALLRDREPSVRRAAERALEKIDPAAESAGRKK